ncbi:hypothetical protein [Cylindrospermum sp. FACHB-282]|uniref:hypothetical protein n=1 Tax=Cylindrospermum sp. FACHB-282 TaxID=2692794 RepID=UPI0016829EB4|nr:hypothetical protein [Cylindrospermum sp. FACHB-282]MBD2386353.1 hypothetical protein [Cylindrospermum sp. FACHB-282]
MRLSLLSRNWATYPQILLCCVTVFFTLAISARAETRQLNLTLSSQENQSFQTLVQEAEALAKKSIQQTFESSPEVKNLSVNILGEHYGSLVPLLSVTVSQTNWQKDPRIQPWVKYFSSASHLLGFVKYSQPTSSSQSTVVPHSVPYITENEPNFYQ